MLGEILVICETGNSCQASARSTGTFCFSAARAHRQPGGRLVFVLSFWRKGDVLGLNKKPAIPTASTVSKAAARCLGSMAIVARRCRGHPIGNLSGEINVSARRSNLNYCNFIKHWLRQIPLSHQALNPQAIALIGKNSGVLSNEVSINQLSGWSSFS